MTLRTGDEKSPHKVIMSFSSKNTTNTATLATKTTASEVHCENLERDISTTSNGVMDFSENEKDTNATSSSQASSPRYNPEYIPKYRRNNNNQNFAATSFTTANTAPLTPGKKVFIFNWTGSIVNLILILVLFVSFVYYFNIYYYFKSLKYYIYNMAFQISSLPDSEMSSCGEGLKRTALKINLLFLILKDVQPVTKYVDKCYYLGISPEKKKLICYALSMIPNITVIKSMIALYFIQILLLCLRYKKSFFTNLKIRHSITVVLIISCILMMVLTKNPLIQYLLVWYLLFFISTDGTSKLVVLSTYYQQRPSAY